MLVQLKITTKLLLNFARHRIFGKCLQLQLLHFYIRNSPGILYLNHHRKDNVLKRGKWPENKPPEQKILAAWHYIYSQFNFDQNIDIFQSGNSNELGKAFNLQEKF